MAIRHTGTRDPRTKVESLSRIGQLLDGCSSRKNERCDGADGIGQCVSRKLIFFVCRAESFDRLDILRQTLVGRWRVTNPFPHTFSLDTPVSRWVDSQRRRAIGSVPSVNAY